MVKVLSKLESSLTAVLLQGPRKVCERHEEAQMVRGNFQFTKGGHITTTRAGFLSPQKQPDGCQKGPTCLTIKRHY